MSPRAHTHSLGPAETRGRPRGAEVGGRCLELTRLWRRAFVVPDEAAARARPGRVIDGGQSKLPHALQRQHKTDAREHPHPPARALTQTLARSAHARTRALTHTHRGKQKAPFPAE